EYMGSDGACSEGLTCDHHLLRVAAKSGDVVANPFQSGILVQITVVAGMPPLLLRELRMCHEAQRAHAVVEVHEHCTLARNLFAPVDGDARRADRPASAINEHDHRQMRTWVGGRWRPEIQVQTILAGGLLSKVMIDVVGAKHLDTLRSLSIRSPHTVPLGGLGRLPPQLLYGRRRVRHAKVSLYSRGELSADNLPPARDNGVSGDWHPGRGFTLEAQ